MATSFKKKTLARSEHPRGTRRSLHSTQLLISTGVPSLDALLGGGLGVGTVILVEEDAFASYSYLLLKYFLSEGVMCGHSLLVTSTAYSPADILAELPGPSEQDHSSGELSSLSEEADEAKVEGDREESSIDDEMKIAWRYQNKPKIESSFSSKYGHSFDLTKSMAREKVEAVETILLDLTACEAKSSTELYSMVASSISKTIQNSQFGSSGTTSSNRTVLRIGLHSLGSPLWLEQCAVEPGNGYSTALPLFLHSLRGMLRQANAAAMITMPTHLFQDAAFVRRLERLSDCVIRLESFAGSVKEQNPVYKEYHGLLHLIKLPQLNSLVCHYPETFDLAFKLKRKKFSIERLHLPPELTEIASRPQEDPVAARRERGRERKPARDSGSVSLDF